MPQFVFESQPQASAEVHQHPARQELLVSLRSPGLAEMRSVLRERYIYPSLHIDSRIRRSDHRRTSSDFSLSSPRIVIAAPHAPRDNNMSEPPKKKAKKSKDAAEADDDKGGVSYEERLKVM